MAYTERKHCDTCQAESVHLKEDPANDIEEECLPCGWRDLEEFWKEQIKELGLDEAKKQWEDIRDSQMNKEIERELAKEEKIEWYRKCIKVNHLFLPQQEDPTKKQTTNYTPWIIGGIGIFATIALIIVLIMHNNRKNRNRY